MVESTASIRLGVRRRRTPEETPGSGETCSEQDRHCITCGDEGIAMRVIAHGTDLAVCADGRDERHQVAVDLVAPVQAGDEVLVHAGVAIRHLGVAP